MRGITRWRNAGNLRKLGIRQRQVTEPDLVALERTVDGIVEAAANKDSRLSYDRDLAFHRQCWELSGNKFLSRALENIVGPLFAFVQGKSPTGMTEADAREHLNIVDALRSLKEPDFSSLVRSTLSGFAIKNLSSMTQES